MECFTLGGRTCVEAYTMQDTDPANAAKNTKNPAVCFRRRMTMVFMLRVRWRASTTSSNASPNKPSPSEYFLFSISCSVGIEKSHAVKTNRECFNVFFLAFLPPGFFRMAFLFSWINLMATVVQNRTAIVSKKDV